MHMADALISPSVGGAIWAASAGLIAYCSKKIKDEADDSRIPLMGVAGAFIFAAQMINFTIPGTGSSGHLGGGLLLSILLGPYSAFLTTASVLVIQSLFFADGGLLALGCNIFNLGVFPCFIAYPLIFKRIVGKNVSQTRLTVASIIAAVVGLELGALAVVFQTLFSGISEIPFKPFILMMLPIHVAIGIVEGFVTATVAAFIRKARPEIISDLNAPASSARISFRGVLAGLLVTALITGGFLSWFASENPDGLEWSIMKAIGKEAVEAPSVGIHKTLSGFQEKTAFLPDYGFKAGSGESEPSTEAHVKWPAVNGGTSLSGLIGGILTITLIGLFGFVLKRRNIAA